MNAIQAQNLSRSFFTVKRTPGLGGMIRTLTRPERTETQAVKDVTFEIAEGEVVGFLGPNGAGKTTTIKMLTGILYPTSGEARVLGEKPFDRKADWLRQIAVVMGNKNQLWWDLPARATFEVMREIYDIDSRDYQKRLDFLIEHLQVADKIDTQVRRMSLGERMKCQMISSLLHRPRVLFLDEPTIGLDVVSQLRVRDFLRTLNEEDRCTIILTSHYMKDVAELCERVILIDHGTKVFDGPLDTLSSQFANERRLRLTFSHPVEAGALTGIGEVIESTEESALVAVSQDRVAEATRLALQDLPVEDIAVDSVSLDEVLRKLFSR